MLKTSKSDFGINVGPKEKAYLNDLQIEYVENPIRRVFDEKDGTTYQELGVTKIKDPMLMKEWLNWTPKINADRIVSFGLALWAVKIFNEMNNIQVVKKEYTQEEINRRSKPIKRKMFNSYNNKMFNKTKMF